MKTKIGENEVDRNITVKEIGKDKFEVTDEYKSIKLMTVEEFYSYCTQINQASSQMQQQIKQGRGQVEILWKEVEQNDDLMKVLLPYAKKAQLKLQKKQKERERVGKQNTT